MNIYFGFERKPLWFSSPRAVVACHRLSDLKPALQKVERWLQAGYYAAGFFAYEAGYAFEKKLANDRPAGFPFLCLGAYGRPALLKCPFRKTGGYSLSGLRCSTSFDHYAANIRRIREYIAQGDVYQITYCIKYAFRFQGDAGALFADLYQYQPVPYAAYVEAGPYKILCLSPERFVRKRGAQVLAEPMKGTWPRGNGLLADWKARRQFARDPKNRAENVMIADLLRNDLGRIGWGIKAPKLFTVTPYRTLFQMTSTVTGMVPVELKLYDLLAALFPSGSVTGAPKIRAMQIIRELEPEARKIYTGAIGYIAPDRDLYFNIPIRTLLIQGNRGEMGVGGGIVWDSTARGEWEEGRLKARFLREIAGA